MKNVLLILLVLLSTDFLFGAVLVVDLNTANNAQFSSFNEAHNAANDGDTIYLVKPIFPLSYGNLILSKQLVLSGNGMNPIFGGGEESKLTEVNDVIVYPSGQGSTITNLFLNSATINSNDITFVNCQITNSLAISSSNLSQIISNTTIRNCILGFIDNNPGTAPDSNIINTLISNCLIRSLTGISNATVQNNLILAVPPDTRSNCVFKDNLFVTRFSASIVSTSDVVFQNNLFYSFDDNYPSSVDTLQNIIGVNPLTNINIEDYYEPGGGFLIDTWEYDFSYESNSPLINAGSDGTDIGIFGGQYPCDPNTLGWLTIPKIYFAEINDSIPEPGVIPLEESFSVILKAIPGRIANNIERVEYFIDSDPGLGNGTSLSFSLEQDTAIVNEIFSTIDLPEGFHKIVFRVQDDLNRWYLQEEYNFYIEDDSNDVAGSGEAIPIVAAEYFFDEDPGLGNGTSIEPSVFIGDTACFAQEFSTSGICEGGEHVLFIRVQDELGRWSVYEYESRIFESNSIGFTMSTTNDSIRFGELLNFDLNIPEDFAIDNVFSVQISDVSGDFSNAKEFGFVQSINLSNLQTEFPFFVAGCDYYLRIKANNPCSFSNEIVLSSPELNANFELSRLGLNASFIAQHFEFAAYEWNMGDGTIINEEHPTHEYLEAGNYNVCLSISTDCGTEQVCEIIAMKGVSSYTPTVGGNIGTVTMQITGAGLDTSTIVNLIQGSTVLEPEAVLFSNSNKTTLSVIFDMADAPLGVYDVNISVLGEPTITFEEGFKLENAVVDNVAATIVGRSAIRPFTKSYFDIHIENKSNIDVFGVPLWLVVEGNENVEVEYDFLINLPDSTSGIDLDSIQTFVKVDSLVGASKPAQIHQFILPIVPANYSGDLGFSITASITANIPIEFKVWTQKSYYFAVNGEMKSTEDEDCIEELIAEGLSLLVTSKLPDCEAGLLEKAMEDYFTEIADEIDDVFELIPGYECVASAFCSGIRVGEAINVIIDEGVGANYGNILGLVNSGIIGTVETIAECGLEVSGRAGKIIGLLKEYYEIKEAIDEIFNLFTELTTDGFIDNFEDYEDYIEIGKDCIESYFKRESSKHEVLILFSNDPNEKVGVQGALSNHYIDGYERLNYTIFYENLDTADVPAQIVIINDTVDVNKVDMSTICLGPIRVANDIKIYPPSGLIDFYHIEELEDGLLLKMNASIDTITGHARWYFITLDENTNYLTDDPFAGFLPPNVNKPEGEGSVSYSVRPMENLQTNDSITNKAEIIFDTNESIFTNTWLNTIDKTSPISSMNAVPQTVTDTVLTLSWSGTDLGSGVEYYNVYISENNGPFFIWKYHYSDTSAGFKGLRDSTYQIYVEAIDYVGNKEEKSEIGEISFTMELPDIEGCTNLYACNFNPNANVEDGSCVGPFVWWYDFDNDGVGDSNQVILDCDRPYGYILASNQSCTQQIPLNPGWNLISLDVSPTDKSISSIFGGLQTGNLEFVTGFDNGAKVFNPNDPPFLNTLTQVEDGFGYWVKVQNADVLSVSGACLDDDFRKPFDAGWNLVAYPPDAATSPAAYFAAEIAASNLEFVTGFENGALVFNPNDPPFLNTLQQMKNGFGYWMKVQNAISGKQAENINQSNIFSFINGTSNLLEGSVVTIQTSKGETIGEMQVVQDGYLMTTVVYGDDAQTELVEGLELNEDLQFVWSNEVIDIGTKFKGDLELEKIDLQFDKKDLGFSADLLEGIKVYPNPANNEIYFSWNLSDGVDYSISIYDSQGQLILEESGASVSGMTSLKIDELSDGVYTYKFSLNNETHLGNFVKIE